MSSKAVNVFKREAQTIGESLKNIRGLSAQALEETKIIGESLRNLRQVPEELLHKFDQDIDNLPDDIGLSPDITSDKPILRPQHQARDMDPAERTRPEVDEHKIEGL